MAGDDNHDRVAHELWRTVPSALGLYFGVYDSLFTHKEDCVVQVENSDSPARARPITSNGILEAAAMLRGNPELTLNQACEQLIAARPGATSVTQTVLVSTQAVLMVDPTDPAERWQPDERLVDFVLRRIPEAAGFSAAARSAMENQRSMKAWKLRARFRLSFIGTTNLAHHLLLDPSPDRPTLYIFHYTAFLKAQLGHLRRQKVPKDSDTLACLKMYGYILSLFAVPFLFQYSF